MSRWSTALCRSCSEPIIWATTQRGAKMPVDAEPTPGGTVLLSGPRVRPVATVVSPGQSAAAAAEGVASHRSHFSTCRRADRHRRDIDGRGRRAAQRSMPDQSQGDLFGSGATGGGGSHGG